MEILSNSAEETEEAAAALAGKLRAGDILAYSGGLGAGKTTFTRGLARGLGLPDTVSSPTFALVHEYTGGRLDLCHFDMYRIDGEEALYSTGFYDYLDRPGTVLAIEWSENILFALDMPHLSVDLKLLPDGRRQIRIEGDDGRF
ncbi:MAG: tRNA (adenosine(37)-N6)-threonylcarbamoyltransferase complex ATPase subunit type 1 TsaE [Provencibacterium sp.]|nr:tRNA (adenosine(37)-N6)-threonylcarbamoyltransferase complex ATPase subunit type 1 TsaE [Provencibacterium sp.]